MSREIFNRRCYRLPRAAMARLRFLCEGYDGLLFIRTLDGRAGIVECSWSPSQTADAEALLAVLEKECGLSPWAAESD